jgi:hypothetical protein
MEHFVDLSKFLQFGSGKGPGASRVISQKNAIDLLEEAESAIYKNYIEEIKKIVQIFENWDKNYNADYNDRVDSGTRDKISSMLLRLKKVINPAVAAAANPVPSPPFQTSSSFPPLVSRPLSTAASAAAANPVPSPLPQYIFNLNYAISHNKLEEIQKWLQIGVMYHEDPSENTLNAAIKVQNINLIQQLLEMEPPVKLVNGDSRYNTLTYVILTENDVLIELILRKGATPSNRKDHSNTLNAAINMQKIGLIEYLLKMEPPAKPINGDTTYNTLTYAVKTNKYRIVKLIINTGAIPSNENNSSNTLIAAIKTGNIRIIRALLINSSIYFVHENRYDLLKSIDSDILLLLMASKILISNGTFLNWILINNHDLGINSVLLNQYLQLNTGESDHVSILDLINLASNLDRICWQLISQIESIMLHLEIYKTLPLEIRFNQIEGWSHIPFASYSWKNIFKKKFYKKISEEHKNYFDEAVIRDDALIQTDITEIESKIAKHTAAAKAVSVDEEKTTFDIDIMRKTGKSAAAAASQPDDLDDTDFDIIVSRNQPKGYLDRRSSTNEFDYDKQIFINYYNGHESVLRPAAAPAVPYPDETDYDEKARRGEQLMMADSLKFYEILPENKKPDVSIRHLLTDEEKTEFGFEKMKEFYRNGYGSVAAAVLLEGPFDSSKSASKSASDEEFETYEYYTPSEEDIPPSFLSSSESASDEEKTSFSSAADRLGNCLVCDTSIDTMDTMYCAKCIRERELDEGQEDDVMKEAINYPTPLIPIPINYPTDEERSQYFEMETDVSRFSNDKTYYAIQELLDDIKSANKHVKEAEEIFLEELRSGRDLKKLEESGIAQYDARELLLNYLMKLYYLLPDGPGKYITIKKAHEEKKKLDTIIGVLKVRNIFLKRKFSRKLPAIPKKAPIAGGYSPHIWFHHCY